MLIVIFISGNFMTEKMLFKNFFIPAPQSEQVSHPSLIEKLNDGLHRKLTLISAPAAFIQNASHFQPAGEMVQLLGARQRSASIYFGW
jgi:hypothetical protein